MARVTVEDCLEQVGNHFALVILASERARQIYKDSYSVATSDHRPTVQALKEIASGQVRFEESLQRCLEDYIDELRIRGVKGLDRLLEETDSVQES